MSNFDDIEKMFAAAADAEEDTGEGNFGGTATKQEQPKPAPKVEKQEPVEKPKVSPKPKPEPKVEAAPEPKVEPKPEPKVEPKPEPKKTARPEPKPETESRRSLVGSKTETLFDVNKGVSEDSITKILRMNSEFNKLQKNEKLFVSGYFQSDGADDFAIPKVIFGALTANVRDLDALERITTAKRENPAERAFYLMDLNNDNIEAIYEQVELLTGELGKSDRVSNENKIQVCRKIEKAISGMPDDIFAYIDKLRKLTGIASEK